MVSGDSSTAQSSAARSALALLETFGSKRILLIGDTILDVHVYGTAIGKAAETPTIVARESSTTQSLGGAFLVARNILELGGWVDMVTLVGQDEEADAVRRYGHPRFTEIAVEDLSRRTTIKKRFWVNEYKLLQFDTLDNRAISTVLMAETCDRIRQRIEGCDAVIVSDYRHGFLTPELAREIVSLCSNVDKPLYVDSQLSQSTANHAVYFGANAFVLNLHEAQAIDSDFEQFAESPAAFDRLRTLLGAGAIVVKLGADGSSAYVNGRRFRLPGLPVHALDTCGAGDAFLAALSLAGLNAPHTSLLIANHWAALSTTIRGTDPPALAALRQSFASLG